MDINSILNLPKSIKIIQRIGQGAHANVYKCEIEGNITCLKYMIKNDLSSQSSLQKEFELLQRIKNNQLELKIFEQFNVAYQNYFSPLRYDESNQFIYRCIPQPHQLKITSLYSYMEFELLEGTTISVKQGQYSNFNYLSQNLLLFLFYLHHQLNLVWGDVAINNILVDDHSCWFIDFENAAQLHTQKQFPQAPRYAHLSQVNTEQAELQSAGFVLFDILYKGKLPWDGCIIFEKIQFVKQKCLQSASKYFGFNPLLYWMITGKDLQLESTFEDYQIEFKEFQGF